MRGGIEILAAACVLAAIVVFPVSLAYLKDAISRLALRPWRACQCGARDAYGFHHSHCGCCGRPVYFGEWCVRCVFHIRRDPGLFPWKRTYYAQHKRLCPHNRLGGTR
jgi:hypothetical protein